MSVKIKLKRMGKIRAPYYRIVVADARTKRDGRAIEEIGIYHPKEDPSRIEVNSERAQYWLGVGAQPTDPVRAILKRTGDWQTFRGEPAPPPLLVAAEKASTSDRYASLMADVHAEEADATTKSKARKRTESRPAAESSSDAPAGAPADAGAAEETPPAADTDGGQSGSSDSASGEVATADTTTDPEATEAGSDAGGAGGADSAGSADQGDQPVEPEAQA